MRLNLRMERLKKRLTQKEVANTIGISNQTLSDYESGKVSPCYDTMVKLSKFFNQPIEYLFKKEEE